MVTIKLTKKQNELLQAIKQSNDQYLYVEIGKIFKQKTIDSLISSNIIEIHDLERGGAWGDDTAFVTLK